MPAVTQDLPRLRLWGAALLPAIAKVKFDYKWVPLDKIRKELRSFPVVTRTGAQTSYLYMPMEKIGGMWCPLKGNSRRTNFREN